MVSNGGEKNAGGGKYLLVCESLGVSVSRKRSQQYLKVAASREHGKVQRYSQISPLCFALRGCVPGFSSWNYRLQLMLHLMQELTSWYSHIKLFL